METVIIANSWKKHFRNLIVTLIVVAVFWIIYFLTKTVNGGIFALFVGSIILTIILAVKILSMVLLPKEKDGGAITLRLDGLLTRQIPTKSNSMILIPWSLIAWVSAKTDTKPYQLLISLKDLNVYLNVLTPNERKNAEHNQALYNVPIALMANVFEDDPDQVARMIEEYREKALQIGDNASEIPVRI